MVAGPVSLEWSTVRHQRLRLSNVCAYFLILALLDDHRMFQSMSVTIRIRLRIFDVAQRPGVVGRARLRRRRHLFGCKSAQASAVQITVLHVPHPVEG